jgi:hypothetical protein
VRRLNEDYTDESRASVGYGTRTGKDEKAPMLWL